MPAKKKIVAKKAASKAPAKKTAVAKKAAKAVKVVAPKAPIVAPAPKPKAKSLYIDSSFFFPYNNAGYADHLQEGRVSLSGDALIAPILLPVGSVMKTVTIYYKNNTEEEISVWILKYHIAHHAYSGEVEVTYEGCPAGVSAPDNFLQKVINHFDAGGKILDKYMYHIEVGPTVKTATEERILRGIRIVYTEPV